MKRVFRDTVLQAIILLAGMLLFALPARSALPYSDNFDTDPTAACAVGWTCTTAGTGPATVLVPTIAPPAYSGTNLIYVNYVSTTANTTSPSLGSLAERITVQYWVKPLGFPVFPGGEEVQLRDNVGATAVAVRMTSSGIAKFQYMDTTGTYQDVTCASATALAASNWYRVKIVDDPAVNTFDLAIFAYNGAQKCSMTSVPNRTNVTNIDKIFAQSTAASAKFYIDSVLITKTATLNVTTATGNPPSTKVLNTATNVPMLRINLAETKGQEDVKFATITFRASGTGNDLTGTANNRVCLYDDIGASPGVVDGGDNLIGLSCKNFSANDGTVTFGGLTQTVPAGTSRNFLLAYDFGGATATAANTQTFVASITPATDILPPSAVVAPYTELSATASVTGGAITGNTMTIDIVPPAQSAWSITTGSTVTNATQTITFNLDEPGTCKWALTDQAYGAMANTCSGAGTTSQSCDITGLAEGANTVSLSCIDLLLNANTAGNNTDLAITLDTMPPVQSSWNPADTAVLTTTTPAVTFTLNENGTCRWSLADDDYNTMVNACAGGGSTAQSCPVTGLAQASNTVYFACVDTFANANTAANNIALTYFVDSLPPVQSAWSPADNSVLTTTSPTTTFNLDEVGDCKWSATDQSYAAMANACAGSGTAVQSCAVTGLPQATSSVYFACRDALLNADTAGTNTALTYFVDSLPPVQSGWSPADNSVITTTSPTATFTLDENGDCKWSLTDDAYGAMANTCSGNGTTAQSCAVTGLPQASSTIYFACRDTLLNADTAGTNSALTYFVDSLPPVQSAWTPAKGATLTTTSPAVTLTLDEAGDCRWALTSLGYAGMVNACTGAGTTSQSCSVTGLPQGADIVYIACNDTLGNANIAANAEQVNYTVDSLPPVQSAWSPADGARINTSSPAVTFTLNENGDCKWSIADQAYGAMVNVCAGTTAQSCPVTGLALATNTVYFACRDTLLNADTAGTNTALSLFVDTVAPVFNGIQYLQACGSGCMNVYWNPASDAQNSYPVTYKVYKSTTSGGQNFAVADATTNATSTQLTGLTNDTAYYIVVRSADAANNAETNTVELIGITTTLPTLAKHPDNPVLTGDGSGFDETGAGSPSVYYDGSLFHMWYTGRSAAGASIGYAISLDGVNWATATGPGAGGAVMDTNTTPAMFDSTALGGPYVYANPPTSAKKYFNWYGGNLTPNTFRIGLAESDDGINWTRVPGPGTGGSALDWSPGKFDNFSIYAPSVLYEGGLYKAWYSGIDQNVASASYFYRIGYATSADGISWTKYPGSMAIGSVLDKGFFNGDFDYPRTTNPNVYKENGVYKMLYSGFDNANPAVGHFRIGFAASLDGLHWTKNRGTGPGGSIMDVGSQFDTIIAARSSLQVINGGLHIWYEGYDGTTYYVMYANNTGVMPPKITAITVAATGGTAVRPGISKAFTATCTYAASNPYCGASTCPCTSDVAWHSGNPAAAGIGELTGLATGSATGTTVITAQCGGIVSNNVTFTVDSNPPAFAGILPNITTCGSGCLNLSWNAATDAEGSTPITYNVYRATTSAGQNFSSVNYSTGSLTLQVTGLTNRQKYFFVVRAMDAAGNEDGNSVEASGTPLIFDTTPPSAVTVRDGIGLTDINFQQNTTQLSASWSASTDAESGIVAYWYAAGTSAGATDVVNWTSAGTATFVTANGLTLGNGVKYYFSVKAQNGADLYGAVSTSNGVTVDVASPTVAITSPAAGASATSFVTVTGTVSDLSLSSWTLSYGPGASPAQFRDIATGTAQINNGPIAVWNTTSLAGTYTLKLYAADMFGRNSQATVTVTVANNTITVTGVVPAFKWVMLSAPAQPVQTAPLTMFGSTGDYKLYRWDPATANNTYTFQYRFPAALNAGHGFWVKSYGADLPYSYTASPVDTTQNYSIPVKSGWNQIGTPLNRAFTWGQAFVSSNGSTYDLATAASMGLVSTTIQGYNSLTNSWVQYDATGQMQPQSGYFMRAFSDVSLLFGPGTGLAGGLARRIAPVYDYKLKISASAPNSADTDNYIGSVNVATETYDALDAEEPPRSMADKYTSLYFPHDDWTQNAGRYANDYRPLAAPATQDESWNFNVETNESGAPVTLTWDSASLPAAGYAFTLKNTDTGESVDMTKAGAYTFTAPAQGVSTAHFKVQAAKQNAPGDTIRTLGLSKGWNLIGFPFKVDLPLPAEIKTLLDGVLKTFIGGGAYAYVDGKLAKADESLVPPGAGFWIYSDTDVSAEISLPSGIIPSWLKITIPVTPGWNAIGNPFDTSLAWGDNITVACGSGASMTLTDAVKAGLLNGSLYFFDTAAQDWRQLSLDDVKSKGGVDFWRAFLIKATADCDITIAK